MALRPAKHRQPAVKGTVYARVQKVHTVPVPAGPVYKKPRCYPYPCGTLPEALANFISLLDIYPCKADHLLIVDFCILDPSVG